MADAPKWVADDNVLAPALHFAAITKHDSDNNAFGLTRAIYVGTTGDIVAVGKDGTAVTFKAVPQGTILPIRCIRVNNSGTSADLVALY